MIDDIATFKAHDNWCKAFFAYFVAHMNKKHFENLMGTVHGRDFANKMNESERRHLEELAEKVDLTHEAEKKAYIAFQKLRGETE